MEERTLKDNGREFVVPVRIMQDIRVRATGPVEAAATAVTAVRYVAVDYTKCVGCGVGSMQVGEAVEVA